MKIRSEESLKPTLLAAYSKVFVFVCHVYLWIWIVDSPKSSQSALVILALFLFAFYWGLWMYMFILNINTFMAFKYAYVGCNRLANGPFKAWPDTVKVNRKELKKILKTHNFSTFEPLGGEITIAELRCNDCGLLYTKEFVNNSYIECSNVDEILTTCNDRKFQNLLT